jgi:hypothetical protein
VTTQAPIRPHCTAGAAEERRVKRNNGHHGNRQANGAGKERELQDFRYQQNKNQRQETNQQGDPAVALNS